jgi:hypothetical protein
MRGNLAYLNVLDCKAALEPRVSGVFKHGFLTLKHQAFEFPDAYRFCARQNANNGCFDSACKCPPE